MLKKAAKTNPVSEGQMVALSVIYYCPKKALCEKTIFFAPNLTSGPSSAVERPWPFVPLNDGSRALL